ncbi:hypothetical protein H5410_018455 [Solanum commersonii]|uniref:Uncharacterized protein n=1 Tax=Solanum commersonii TaxID=4109 RepID=A0A9J6A3F4_SOLCO|nr:hypothetical protein H5410_018455 [Solanum commersonii]
MVSELGGMAIEDGLTGVSTDRASAERDNGGNESLGHVRADCNKLKKDNCYLLIGYPDNFKGKKKVNTVMGDCIKPQRQMSNMQDHVDWKAHTTIGEQSPGGNQGGNHVTQ